MPYKVVGKCVHKLNADGSVGKVVPGGCHESAAKAQAHKRALYANVEKEAPMSSSRKKRRAQRREETRQMRKELQDDDVLSEEEELALLESDVDEESNEEELEKSFGEYEASEMAMQAGPVSFEQLDEARATAHKAGMIRELSWDVQDLVSNIIHTPMLQGTEKADAIKKVGDDFGARVQGIMDTPDSMMKENDDPEVLEIEALIAQDERDMNFLEKAWQAIQKKDTDSLDDISNKTQVRNALAYAVQQIRKGGEAAQEARKALPKIRAAAKKMGIGDSMKKEKSGIIIQKDANGDWRWVGWPSNNFIDRSKDILIEKAHREYVEWWNKEERDFPVFTSLHAPGTARTYPVDFVGYENGFLVMSGKLTDGEATDLLRVQKNYDIGMSHTGYGVRDADDPRQIVMYRIFEVTDLPIERADNPFTDLSVISKEADMVKKSDIEYLAKLFNSQEEGDEAWQRAENALSSKTKMKQKMLQDAGVEQKEADGAQDEPETAPESPAVPDIQQLVEQFGKEFNMDGLNEWVQKAQDAIDKIPMLEEVIKQQQEEMQKLTGEQDEQLAQKIAPPIAGKFAWSKSRASQSEETLVSEEEKDELARSAPGIPNGDEFWLSQVTGTTPVTVEAEN